MLSFLRRSRSSGAGESPEPLSLATIGTIAAQTAMDYAAKQGRKPTEQIDASAASWR
jgi:hypothetical protein